RPADPALAPLAGAYPIPASSGHTVRHRLNRGGDRALNRAIHTIATVRMRDCPATKAYIARRAAEDTTIREIKRCLKLYITRSICMGPMRSWARALDVGDAPVSIYVV